MLRNLFIICCFVGTLCFAEEYQVKDYSNLIGMKGFSDNLLNQHFKLYQGYVKNTNVLNQKISALTKSGKDRTLDYAGLKRMFGWEFDGMRLHESYFENLGGSGKLDAKSDLNALIVSEFGSLEKWKSDFTATGMIRGIGWAILAYDPHGKRLFNVWINEHNLGHLSGSIPLVVMDVWEHAYITEYGLDRAGYIKAFLDNIDWNTVSKRF